MPNASTKFISKTYLFSHTTHDYNLCLYTDPYEVSNELPLPHYFKPESLTPSCQTIKKYAEHICRLYEQGASYKRIRRYIRRWVSWVCAGVVVTDVELFALAFFRFALAPFFPLI